MASNGGMDTQVKGWKQKKDQTLHSLEISRNLEVGTNAEWYAVPQKDKTESEQKFATG